MPDYQMSLAEIDQLIDAVKGSNHTFDMMILSGGEPLLWENIEEGIRRIKESGITKHLRVYSNAKAQHLVVTHWFDYLDSIRVSLHAGNDYEVSRLRMRFPDRVTVVDRRLHAPLFGQELCEPVLPAKCVCPELVVCDQRVSMCPAGLATIFMLKGTQKDYPEFYTDLSPGFLDRLKDKGFHREYELLCSACIGNKKLRPESVNAQK